MNPLHQQSRAAGYAEPATHETNNAVYERLIGGDQSARDEMIQANMALVAVKVEGFIRRNPDHINLRDDLMSEGMVGLVEAVDRMAEKAVAKPSAYIGQSIQNALIDFVEKESPFRISRRSRQRAIRQDREITGHRKVAMTTEAFGEIASDDPMEVFELRDFIDSCCSNNLELQIVKMREAGSTYQEIATELGTPLNTVNRAMQDIYRRFLARSGMKDK